MRILKPFTSRVSRNRSTALAGRMILLLIGIQTCLPGYAAERYFGLGAGITYAPNERISGTETTVDYDLGFRVGSLVYGARFDNGWRAELEASYRRNELEILLTEGQPIFNTGTHDSVQALSFMANGTYEFDVNLPIYPYVGGGIGVSGVFYNISDHESPTKILDDEALAMAYQLYAGLMIPLGQRWQIAADYRWWQSLDVNMTTEAGEDIKFDYSTRVFNLNFRRLLGDARNRSEPEQLPAEQNRWYLDSRLGSAFAADSDIDDRGDSNFDAFDVGIAATVALGYSHIRPSGGRLRAELEIQAWENDADVIDFGPVLGEFPLNGSVKVRGAAANVLYDFAPGWKLRPYAGLGVGYASVDYDVTIFDGADSLAYVNDSDSGVAVQALLGFGIRLTRATELSFNYRYWLTPSVKLTDPAGSLLETEHAAHLVMIGFRFALGKN